MNNQTVLSANADHTHFGSLQAYVLDRSPNVSTKQNFRSGLQIHPIDDKVAIGIRAHAFVTCSQAATAQAAQPCRGTSINVLMNGLLIGYMPIPGTLFRLRL
jgi:hypothetical protein